MRQPTRRGSNVPARRNVKILAIGGISILAIFTMFMVSSIRSSNPSIKPVRVSEPVQVDIPVINDNNNYNNNDNNINNNNFAFDFNNDNQNKETANNDINTEENLNPNIKIEEDDDNDNTNNVIEDTKETPDPAIALENQKRLEAVRKGMEHAWGGYVKYAWGDDEVRPVSKIGYNWLGMGGSIIDSLDTLWIMGLKDEFNRARDWVRDNFDPAIGIEVSFFETTIRVIGGLLSAYALSGDEMFINKAKVLGENLLKALDDKSGIPYSMVNLQNGYKQNHHWCQGRAILADIGTVQLEYVYLSAVTGNPSYGKRALRILDTLFEANKDLEGKLTAYVDPGSGRCTGGAFSLNGLTDSYFEYLVKLWVFLGGYKNPMAAKYREKYNEASDSIRKYLVHVTKPSGLVIMGGYEYGSKSLHMEHLGCFSGGMFALGATAYNSSKTPNHDSKEHLELAEGITRTCYEIYHRTTTHVGPETINGADNDREDYTVEARHSILRPEAVESIFYLWRTTHDQKYRDWGWEIFQGFEKYCKAAGGYSGITDVYSETPNMDDSQPTWFLAETLKYLYLLFAPDDLIPLDKYVFNTEAHPFPILDPSFKL